MSLSDKDAYLSDRTTALTLQERFIKEGHVDVLGRVMTVLNKASGHPVRMAQEDEGAYFAGNLRIVDNTANTHADFAPHVRKPLIQPISAWFRGPKTSDACLERTLRALFISAFVRDHFESSIAFSGLLRYPRPSSKDQVNGSVPLPKGTASQDIRNRSSASNPSEIVKL